jgi:hypothetical protein
MRTWNIIFCALLLNAIALTRAYALAGDLSAPSLAFPATIPEARRDKVMAAISDKGCKFLDGNFINSNTTLHYGGGTESLNHLLAKLGECDGVGLRITFVKEPGGPAWTLNHNGWGSDGQIQIYVQINLVSSAIDLEKLEINVAGHGKAP